MPLKPGSSRAVVSQNIREMMHSGYPQKQAIAASLSNARRHPGRAEGGLVNHDHDPELPPLQDDARLDNVMPGLQQTPPAYLDTIERLLQGQRRLQGLDDPRFFYRPDRENGGIPQLRGGRRHRRGSPPPPDGTIEELWDTSRPRPPGLQDGGSCGSCEGSCGGSWGDAGAADFSGFDATGGVGTAAFTAGQIADFNMSNPGVSTGPGEWGGWGSWATSTGDIANIMGNLANFNVQDPNNINVNLGRSFDQPFSTMTTSNWAQAGLVNTEPTGSVFGGGWSTPSSGGFSRGTSDIDPTDPTGDRGYITSPGFDPNAQNPSRDVTPPDPDANIPSTWDQEPGDRGSRGEPETKSEPESKGSPDLASILDDERSQDTPSAPEASPEAPEAPEAPQAAPEAKTSEPAAVSTPSSRGVGEPEVSPGGGGRGVGDVTPSETPDYAGAPYADPSSLVDTPSYVGAPYVDPTTLIDTPNYVGAPYVDPGSLISTPDFAPPSAPGWLSTVGDWTNNWASNWGADVPAAPGRADPNANPLDVLTQSGTWYNTERGEKAFAQAPSIFAPSTWSRDPFAQTVLSYPLSAGKAAYDYLSNLSVPSLPSWPGTQGYQEPSETFEPGDSGPAAAQSLATQLGIDQIGANITPAEFAPGQPGMTDFQGADLAAFAPGEPGMTDFTGSPYGGFSLSEPGHTTFEGAPTVSEFSPGQPGMTTFEGSPYGGFSLSEPGQTQGGQYADVLDTGSIAYQTAPDTAYSPGAQPQDEPGYYASPTETAANAAAVNTGASQEAANAASAAAAESAANGGTPSEQGDAAAVAAAQAGATAEQANAIGDEVAAAAAARGEPDEGARGEPGAKGERTETSKGETRGPGYILAPIDPITAYMWGQTPQISLPPAVIDISPGQRGAAPAEPTAPSGEPDVQEVTPGAVNLPATTPPPAEPQAQPGQRGEEFYGPDVMQGGRDLQRGTVDLPARPGIVESIIGVPREPSQELPPPTWTAPVQERTGFRGLTSPGVTPATVPPGTFPPAVEPALPGGTQTAQTQPLPKTAEPGLVNLPPTAPPVEPTPPAQPGVPPTIPPTIPAIPPALPRSRPREEQKQEAKGDQRDSVQNQGKYTSDPNRGPIGPDQPNVVQNQGSAQFRTQTINSSLNGILDKAAEAAGVQVSVFSGGQMGKGEKGSAGHRTGSIRHDHGNAADVQLFDRATGRLLDFTKPGDKAQMQAFVREAARLGATGQGAAANYMGTTSIHVGFGGTNFWGAKGGGAPNADLRSAWAEGVQSRGERGEPGARTRGQRAEARQAQQAGRTTAARGRSGRQGRATQSFSSRAQQSQSRSAAEANARATYGPADGLTNYGPQDRGNRDIPASLRYNNPGAAMANRFSAQFGMTDYNSNMDRTGRNSIAGYPTQVHGLANNIALAMNSYVGKSISNAMRTWSGANRSVVGPGYPVSTKGVLTQDMVLDPAFWNAMVGSESGRGGGLTTDQINEAIAMYQAGSAEAWEMANPNSQTTIAANAFRDAARASGTLGRDWASTQLGGRGERGGRQGGGFNYGVSQSQLARTLDAERQAQTAPATQETEPATVAVPHARGGLVQTYADGGDVEPETLADGTPLPRPRPRPMQVQPDRDYRSLLTARPQSEAQTWSQREVPSGRWQDYQSENLTPEEYPRTGLPPPEFSNYEKLFRERYPRTQGAPRQPAPPKEVVYARGGLVEMPGVPAALGNAFDNVGYSRPGEVNPPMPDTGDQQPPPAASPPQSPFPTFGAMAQGGLVDMPGYYEGGGDILGADDMGQYGNQARAQGQAMTRAYDPEDLAKPFGYAKGGGLDSSSMRALGLQSHFTGVNVRPELALSKPDSPGVHLINSSVPGRTDRLPMRARTGSFILPADVVSGLGQGNTSAGAKMWGQTLAHAIGPMGISTAIKTRAMRAPSLRMPSPTVRQAKMPGFKFQEGGEVEDEFTPIITAGGEAVVDPEIVEALGGGDAELGKRMLTDSVKSVRKQVIAHLRSLPGPVQ